MASKISCGKRISWKKVSFLATHAHFLRIFSAHLWNDTQVQPTQLPSGCGRELGHARPRPGDPAERPGRVWTEHLDPVGLLPNTHGAPVGRVRSGFQSSQPNQTCLLSDVMSYPSLPTSGRTDASTATLAARLSSTPSWAMRDGRVSCELAEVFPTAAALRLWFPSSLLFGPRRVIRTGNCTPGGLVGERSDVPSTLSSRLRPPHRRQSNKRKAA